MRKKFIGFYELNDEEIKKLWDECVFTFDANALLNLYRYTEAAQDNFFEIVESLKDRIWLSYQAGYEYHKNRENKIEKQFEAYDKIAKGIKDKLGHIKGILNAHKKHCLINVEELLGALSEAETSITNNLETKKDNHPNIEEEYGIMEKITALFDGKTGNDYDIEKKEKLYEEGEKRFREKIPPGYEDSSSKDYPERFGDLILWFQLIDYIKTNEKPLILITDERKQDWWLTKAKETLRPRPELLNEMYEKTSKRFYMYQTDDFVEYAQKYLEIGVNEEVVEEIREIRKHDEEYPTYVKYLPPDYFTLGQLGADIAGLRDISKHFPAASWANLLKPIDLGLSQWQNAIRRMYEPIDLKGLITPRGTLEILGSTPLIKAMENYHRMTRKIVPMDLGGKQTAYDRYQSTVKPPTTEKEDTEECEETEDEDESQDKPDVREDPRKTDEKNDEP